ncbi:MAG: type II toxin-antitoxin system PemK/MazF family toxin [Caldilineaceae bacterium]
MTFPTSQQLEIRWVDLDPTRGTETRKKRPCILLQSTIVNHASRTLIVAPILPGHKDWPFAVNLVPSKQNGLDKERHINIKQLRAVDVSRLDNRQGVLEDSYIAAVHDAIRIVFGLE